MFEDYLKTHSTKEAADHFGISMYLADQIKHKRVRKNSAISNKKWYDKHAKEYFSDLEVRKRQNLGGRKHYAINRSNILKEEKKRRSRKRLCTLASYVNQDFRRRDGKEELITPQDLWRIAKKQKLICPITGLKLNNETISVDHVIPVSKGGSNIVNNLRLVHRLANIMRQNKSDQELIKFCRAMICGEKYDLDSKFGGKRDLNARAQCLYCGFTRRTKQKSSRVRAIDLWLILKKQRLKCALTGIKLTLDNLSYDHIIPVSKGGNNDPSNLRAVHIWANKMRLAVDWSSIYDIAKTIVDYQSSI